MDNLELQKLRIEKCFMITKLVLGLGLGFMALGFAGTGTAQAEDHVGIGVGIGGHKNGHYEDRSEQVMVQPAGEERRVIPAQYETITHRSGREEQRLVSPERVEIVVIPARYETRVTQVWVEERESGGLHLGIHF